MQASSTSSLVGSIFGSEECSNSSGLLNVFEASSTLPDRPHHVPPPRSNRKKKKKETTVEDASSASASASTVIQRRPAKALPDKTDTDTRHDPKQSATAASTNSNNDQVQGDNSNDINDTNTPPPSDESPDDRTIFVGNLPLNTTRNSLKSIFTKCGKVESTRLRSIATTGVKLPPDQKGNQALVQKVSVNTKHIDAEARTSAQGYVVFVDPSSVDTAIQTLNNTLLPGTQHWIRVDRVTPTMDASRSVFVGNLPYSADETSLRQHFVKGCALSLTDIENVRIVRDKLTQQCKGFGYVLFTTKTMVTTALSRMHESIYQKRTLRVTVCGKRFKGRQGEKPLEKHSKNTPSNADATADAAAGALKRILSKEAIAKKRKRGSSSTSTAVSSSMGPNSKKQKSTSATTSATNPKGLSRRQASELKLEKRHKKLQKRASKGMGKTKKGF